uniref:Eukaryotic translation initiation factor 3 subunit G N-terminal domain-containing protein n=1 Tax=Tanacetum cinerariifolium TaxID=118510 RepID=A0A6L2KT99_TANCI|nr:hypothetical protein [Tanacetum cinerariifolium]
MIRSSTKELFTPFKDLERKFRSSRKYFKTLSLDESRSPDFDLFSDQEEYSEEEVAETMAKTMEQYMCKTRPDYGSGVARPKIEDKDNFKLKGQFLKELRTNTFNGSDHEDANEHIEKVLEIVDLFHIPNITIDQVMLRAFPSSSKTVADAKVAIQEMAEYFQKWHNETSRTRSTETSDGLAAIQAQLNNLGREIKKVNEKVYATQVGCEQCKSPYYTKDCPLKEEGKTLKEAYYTQFGASVSVMPLLSYLNLGLGELAHIKLTVELVDRTVKYPKRIVVNVPVVLEDMDAYRDEGTGGVIFGEPFLREVGINATRFEGMITIHNGNEEVTYQIA